MKKRPEPTRSKWDDSLMRQTVEFLHRFVDTAEGEAALAALCDANDADIRRFWDWLPDEMRAVTFVIAVFRAAHFEQLRSALRGSSKDQFDALPSRVIRVVGRRRKSGAQSDFLRVLGASLLDVGFDIEVSLTQTHVLHLAQKLLGDRGIGLTPSTVSKVWGELLKDDAERRRST